METRVVVLLLSLAAMASTAEDSYADRRRRELRTLREEGIGGKWAGVDNNDGESLFTGCVGENDCCSSSNPCFLAEGDCDTDEDCLGTLVCEKDSCKSSVEFLKMLNNGRLSQGFGKPDFSDSDDCCWLGEEEQELVNGILFGRP